MIRVAARRSAHERAFQRSSPPARCSGGRQSGHSRRVIGALRVDAGEGELLLELHGVRRADPRQVAPRLVVAPHQHVLAVVDELAGLAVEERRRSSSELSASFEHEHPRSALGERTGRGQAGAARADHDDIRRGHFAARNPVDSGDEAIVRIHVVIASRALWNVGTRTRPAKTSYSLVSIRVRRSR